VDIVFWAAHWGKGNLFGHPQRLAVGLVPGRRPLRKDATGWLSGRGRAWRCSWLQYLSAELAERYGSIINRGVPRGGNEADGLSVETTWLFTRIIASFPAACQRLTAKGAGGLPEPFGSMARGALVKKP